jgi:hypothetical protein
MKFTLLSLSLCLMLVTACRNEAKENAPDAMQRPDSAIQSGQTQEDDKVEEYAFNKEKPYAIESGVIKYKYTGDYEGTQTLYFKDYGLKERVEEDYINTKSPTHDKVNHIFISTPDKYIFIDLVGNTGYSARRNDTTTSLQGNLLRDLVTIGFDSTMRKNGYSRGGSRNVSGRYCQIYSGGESSQFCFYKGINIKTEMRLGKDFHYTLEATDIQENASISDDQFQAPQNVKLLDYKTYIKQQTKDKL